MTKICIDPGHGGSDSGAVGPSGLLEKDVALVLKGMLEGAGHEVVMTRDSDIDVMTSTRCRYIKTTTIAIGSGLLGMASMAAIGMCQSKFRETLAKMRP